MMVAVTDLEVVEYVKQYMLNGSSVLCIIFINFESYNQHSQR